METEEMKNYLKSVREAYGIDPYRLYPTDKVAEYLSVEPSVVRWWIRENKITAIKLPNRAWRVQGLEIIRLLEQGKRR